MGLSSEREIIVKRYLEGDSVGVLAHFYNVNPRRIARQIQKHTGKLPSQLRPNGSEQKQIPRDEIVRLHKAGRQAYEIAILLECSRQNIHQVLARYHESG